MNIHREPLFWENTEDCFLKKKKILKGNMPVSMYRVFSTFYRQLFKKEKERQSSLLLMKGWWQSYCYCEGGRLLPSTMLVEQGRWHRGGSLLAEARSFWPTCPCTQKAPKWRAWQGQRREEPDCGSGPGVENWPGP